MGDPVSDRATCEHHLFGASVDVGRLTDVEGGPVTGYSASVRVWCQTCDRTFLFPGLPWGVSRVHPTASADGTELRAPLIPEPLT